MWPKSMQLGLDEMVEGLEGGVGGGVSEEREQFGSFSGMKEGKEHLSNTYRVLSDRIMVSYP